MFRCTARKQPIQQPSIIQRQAQTIEDQSNAIRELQAGVKDLIQQNEALREEHRNLTKTIATLQKENEHYKSNLQNYWYLRFPNITIHSVMDFASYIYNLFYE